MVLVIKLLTKILRELRESYENDDEDDEIDTVHSAETSGDDFIRVTEHPLNNFKNQLILIDSDIESCTKKIIFRKKVRTLLKMSSNSDMLGCMERVLLEKGLVVVFCEKNELFIEF